MTKRLLYLEDLYDFYSTKYKRSTHFSSEKTGEPIVVQVHGKINFEESDKNKDLGEELADVIFVALCLANQTGVDLESAFYKKLDCKTKRDHDRHQNNDKLK